MPSLPVALALSPRFASSCPFDAPFDRLAASADPAAENGLERFGQRLGRIGRRSGTAPANHPIRPHQNGPFLRNAAELRPREPRVEQVAVDMADPDSIDRQIVGGRERGGGCAPALPGVSGILCVGP